MDGWDRARAWQNATLIDTRSLCQIHSFTRDCSSLLLDDDPHGRTERPIPLCRQIIIISWWVVAVVRSRP